MHTLLVAAAAAMVLLILPVFLGRRVFLAEEPAAGGLCHPDPDAPPGVAWCADCGG
ncbi:hypothetical protein [Catellatospora methionotrophica]|uniref:hypothetical protein n=1 Tax=Catellatospora methionotrophica TaxID=121620 RepID=UPI0033EDA0EE